MRKFTVGTFATPRDFVKSGCTKIVDKLSDFSWHFYRFNRKCKLFDAERPSSPAAESGSGADAGGRQVQRQTV
jgi:hypothetical protein